MTGHDSATGRRAKLPQARSASLALGERHPGECADSEDLGGSQGFDQRELQSGGRNETALRPPKGRELATLIVSDGSPW